MATETKSAAVIVVLLTFALGMAAGAGLHASFEPRPPHHRGGWGPNGPGPTGGPKRLPPPLEELDLTAEQRTKAEAVFEKYRAPLEALFEETRPRMHELREKMDAEFAELLTADQRSKFAELKARRPPPPPPPEK
jgi:Spy/CpxP family protein refolding chaperone